MGPREIGLALVWLGSMALVGVLLHRIRFGAWDRKALETAPPIARWARVAAYLGLGAAGFGAALMVWDLS